MLHFGESSCKVSIKQLQFFN